MRMTITSSFYPGSISRPQVHYHINDSATLLCTTVNWGDPAATETVLSCLTTEQTDGEETHTEITLPFADGQGLSKEAKDLKSMMAKINLSIFEKFNKEFYTAGLELMLLNLVRNQLSWIQIGQPHVLLLRENQLTPLQIARDTSLEFGMQTPLPYQLAGAGKQFDASVQTLKVQENDKIFLFTGIELPRAFFLIKSFEQNNLDLIAKTAVAESPDRPFGLAEIIIK